MRLGLLATAIAGCASRAPSVVSNRVEPVTTDRDAWAAVVDGSSFKLDNFHEDQYPQNLAIVVARVTRVDRNPRSRMIHLTWTVDWGGTGAIDVSLYTANNRENDWLPTRVIVTETKVRFDDHDMEWPLTPAKFPDDGRYVEVSDGATCFGYNKSEILDCDEICAARICVDPRRGIVSGEGEGWPNGEGYVRSTR